MIRKFSPIYQNADNAFRVFDRETPGYTGGKVSINSYSIAVNTGTLATVSSIRLTVIGGSATEYALPATYDTTDADERAACIAAINALIFSLGYTKGVGSIFNIPTWTIYTDFSELVFVGLNASGNTFTASTPSKTVGFD